jgi:hypothetical protein
MRFIFGLAVLCTLLSGLGFSLEHVRRNETSNASAAKPLFEVMTADQTRALRLELESQWGRALPPPGTPCSLAWDGFNAHGSLFQISAFNCFESVCYLTSGDPSNFAYRAWPSESVAELDAIAWPGFEKNLHRGDVVEFIVRARERNGRSWSTPFHAQICAADGGLMVGANNEPRFIISHGVPTETMRWAFCTTHQYYDALKGVDQAWRDCGEEHTYSLVVHKQP